MFKNFLKFAAQTSLIFAMLPHAYAATCPLVTTAPYKTLKVGLSPLWAQEYIGADLAKEVVQQRTQKYLTKVGNFDAGFSIRDLKGNIHVDATKYYQHTSENAMYINHGTQSTNNINGLEYGAAAYAQMTHLYSIQHHLIELISNQFLKQPADILNLEIHTLCVLAYESFCKFNADKFGGLAAVKSNLSKLGNKTILVAAAGNNAKIYSKQVTWPMITVGSLAPNASISTFSNQSPDITVLAPSDDYLYSWGYNGAVQFGGTSGASPIAAGAIANVISIAGKQNTSTILNYLQATSIKVKDNSNQPNINGYGMINAYKLAKLADLGGPSTANSEKLSLEAQNLWTQAQENLQQVDCNRQKNGFKQLRQSFLLAPNATKADALAQIYHDENLPENASFYENLAF